jgi:hypothetical protein
MHRPHEHDPTPLGPFPVEIWEACCRFSSPKDFSSLAEVSTFLQAATRRIRFQSLTFSCPPPSEIRRRNVASWTRRMLRGRSRVTSLSADDAASDIRTFVREWKIDGDNLLQKNVPEYPAGILLAQEARLAISTCVESLPAYTNLVTLTLVHVDIDERARSSLSLLPSLRSLSLHECNTCHNTSLRLRLKQFSWKDSATSIESGPIELLDPGELCELRLISSTVRMKDVLTPLMTSDALARLTDLTLSVTFQSDVQDLFPRFIQLCPSLLSLNVLSLSEVVPSFQISVAPNLRTYRGPSQLAEALIPGRPVTTVYLTHFLLPSHHSQNLASIKSVLHRISQSTTPILTLELPTILPGLTLFPFILSFFPMLNVLTMTFEGGLHPPWWSRAPPESEDSDSDSHTRDGESASTYSRGCADIEDDLNAVTVTLERNDLGVSDQCPGLSEKLSCPKKRETRERTKIPLDSHGNPTRAGSTFAGMLDRLQLGFAKLPPHLSSLRLTHCDSSIPRLYSRSEQRAFIRSVCQSLPKLQNVVLGHRDHKWSKEGSTWIR